MFITLIDTWEEYIEKAIEIGKTGIPVRFERDGVHGIKDLEIVAKFQEAGFTHEISTFKGKYEDKAIRVEFRYVSKENGYV